MLSFKQQQMCSPQMNAFVGSDHVYFSVLNVNMNHVSFTLTAVIWLLAISSYWPVGQENS